MILFEESLRSRRLLISRVSSKNWLTMHWTLKARLSKVSCWGTESGLASFASVPHNYLFLFKVRLFGQGMDIVEVSDDGSGIPLESRPHVAERYATSKISRFEDIYSGTGLTMGFRGEALFSLACLSKKMIVATRTEEEEMAQKLEFGKCGSLNTSATQNIHRKVGTTVAVVEPFAGLPARRIDMMRRIRGERAKLFKLMESYAIFNVGVQLNLIDITSSGREDMALATSASSSSIEETISSVLGHKFLGSLSQVQISLQDLLRRGEENMYNWEVRGLVTKNPRDDPQKRTVNYYCINGRVVELPKVTAVLKKVWSGFGGKKKPSCILSMTLPNDAFDINLSPDKQQVLLTHEQEICQLIEAFTIALWTSETQGIFELQELEAPVEDEGDDDESERQKHKRRFAFVHDLAGAKLQHHSDDRHRDNSSQEEGGSHTEGRTGDAETSPEQTVSKRQKAAESTADALHNKGVALAPVRIQEDPISNDRISDMERRKWNAVRSKFNAIDSPGGETLGSATVDSPTRPVSPTTRRVSDSTTSTQSQSRKVKPTESSQNRRQANLKQFAFQSINEPQLSSKGTTDQTQSVEKRQSQRKRVSRQKDGSESETSGEGAIDFAAIPSCEEGDRGSRSETVVMPSPKTSEKTEDYVTDQHAIEQAADASATSGSEEAHDTNEEPASSPPNVVWNTFKSTEDVCHASREERIQMVKRRLDLKRGSCEMSKEKDNDAAFQATTTTVGTKAATKGAKLSLSKEQFRSGMEIIGQFNLGFILAKCENNHLWILDQHACDEKYNFENLCRDTVIHEQKLLHPMALDLSPAEESCILDHIEIFEANGFRFNFDSSAPIRHRLALSALPHSGARDGRKAVQFNKDDVSTLCSILMDGASYDAGDGGTGTDGTGRFGNNAVRRYASTAGTQSDKTDKIIARLPKAIAMFASRACRSSIMIGTALSQREMDKIVSRLADIEHPWNCKSFALLVVSVNIEQAVWSHYSSISGPHGRPTMRHVGEILSTFKRDERRAAEYITDPTITVTPMTQMTQEAPAEDQLEHSEHDD